MMSLRRKRERCLQLMEDLESVSRIEVPGDYSDLEERKIWEIERILEGSTLADSLPELKSEVRTGGTDRGCREAPGIRDRDQAQGASEDPGGDRR